MNKIELKNIFLLNWYGFINVTIPVDDDLTFITGENESGKSTILDAFKYAFIGDTEFNKSSGTAKRDLKSYTRCLIDPTKGTYARPADRYPTVYTHIALEFHDELNKKDIVLGVVIETASSNDISSTRYIIHGKKIKDIRFTYSEGEKEIPYSARKFCETYQTKQMQVNEGLDQFMIAVGLRLSKNYRDDYKRKLRNMMTYKAESRIPEFMKKFVLEEKPVDFKKLKDSKKNIDQLNADLTNVQEELEIIDEILNHYNEYEKIQARQVLDNVKDLYGDNFLKKDYENFKKYIQTEKYPTHMDYLDYEIAPNLDRFIKSKMKGAKNKSYYSFLKKIGEENIPVFSDDEVKVINSIEEMLPIVRMEEFVILKQYIEEGIIDLDELLNLYPGTSKAALDYAYDYLIDQEILSSKEINPLTIKEELRSYLDDAINYAITRYNLEFGEFEGKYKLYRNYYKEQVAMILLKKNIMDLKLKGTYYDSTTRGDTYIFAGLKKDDQGKLNYKDKFLSSQIMQWESVNNTTFDNNEGKKILSTKKVHLFVRKVDEEDGIVLPFTYFGTAKIENIRESFTEENGTRYPTLLCDLRLDNEIPKQYHLDFEVPESK